ncbi:MAG: DUF4838 domain-containing protein [Planctomycetes bacterium]|nr:DUF4838 domain-containing protein [Planctomycetota bacterium]
MLLTANKAPTFSILIDPDAPPAVRHAAEEIQRYIERISLARPAVVTQPGNAHRRIVLVGESARRRRLFPELDPARMEREAYVLHTRGDHLLVLGGSPRGTLYAAYDLLERLGVRWWTPQDELVPNRMLLELPPLRVQVRPPLMYRALWYRHTMDADWQAKARLNAGCMSPVHLLEIHGGGERFAADASAHTYEGLVPTEHYFDRHPEYFCEVHGKRLRHMNQLCPTHPDVADIAAETARRWLEATPGCRLVSVTQNDWGNWCTCKNCAALIEREGAPSGPMLHLANEVARRLHRDYPEVFVDTFGYSWSEKPPRRMKAHPQVLVRLAPIGNCFGHSIRRCPANARCREALEGWSRVARHLFIWHYVTDFFHYLTPFPNLPPLQDDLRSYLDAGVKGIFLQGDGTSLGGDMSELKAYLMARLLWNPSLDAASIRAEFLQGYYQEAAPAVDAYLVTFEKAFAAAGPKSHLFLYRSLWDNDAAYLTRPVLARAGRELERGRRLAQDHPVILDRLDRLQASVDYTELFYHERPGRRIHGKSRCVCPSSPRRRLLLHRFFRTVERARMTHYGEDLGRYTTMDSLRRAWREGSAGPVTFELKTSVARALVTPGLGGRILEYGPSPNGNWLGRGSPKTFGYPCTGGYEEYGLRPHQSPGFSESFQVVSRTRSQALLQARLETGLVIERRIRLDRKTGELAVRSRLINCHEADLPGCLRAHLEIDLRTPLAAIEFWVLRRGTWSRHRGNLGLAWYENEVPDGWAFWSPGTRMGLRQSWPRGHVGAVFLGGIPAEPTVLALDLAHGRSNQTIPPRGCQVLAHRFHFLTRPPMDSRDQTKGVPAQAGKNAS